MTPGLLREKVVAERVSWVRDMVRQARGLPLETRESFLADPRNPASAESYLRRGLEALLDLGRHILAKGFGTPVTEYKQVARGLREVGVLGDPSAELLEKMAGYRNRRRRDGPRRPVCLAPRQPGPHRPLPVTALSATGCPTPFPPPAHESIPQSPTTVHRSPFTVH